MICSSSRLRHDGSWRRDAGPSLVADEIARELPILTLLSPGQAAP